MDWSQVKALTIPEGVVTKVESAAGVLWRKVTEVLKSISFTDSVTVTDAAGGDVMALTQHGRCAQASTPTTATPVDVKCNNGRLRVRNLFRTTGSKATSNGVTFEPQPDGSVLCYGTATGYANWTMGRAYVSPSLGTVTVSVNGTYNASGNIVVSSLGVYDSGGTRLATITYTNWTQSATVDLSQYPTASTIRLEIKRNNNNVVNATIKTQVEVGSSATAWVPYGTVEVAGTAETLAVGSQTASVASLLSCGTVSDEQEVIGGYVTRRVAAIVLDGNEAWVGSSSAKYYSLAKSAISPTPYASGAESVCTHLVSDSSGYVGTQGTLWLGTSYLNINYDNQGGTSSSANMTAFKAFLRNQLAAGTPVVIVFPLATETTEQVTAQPLSLAEGSNAIAATAEVSGIAFDMDYYAVG